MRRVDTRLTVGELRRHLEGVPDETLVLIDFNTQYDGNDVELQGTAIWAAAVESPVRNLRIEAAEERRDELPGP